MGGLCPGRVCPAAFAAGLFTRVTSVNSPTMMASRKVQVPDSQRGSRKPFMKAPGLKRAWGQDAIMDGNMEVGVDDEVKGISYNWLFLSMSG